MWECNLDSFFHLDLFFHLRLEKTECENVRFGVLLRTCAAECKVTIIQFFMRFQQQTSNFAHSHTFMQNKKETSELYKQEKEKWEVRVSAAVKIHCR